MYWILVQKLFFFFLRNSASIMLVSNKKEGSSSSEKTGIRGGNLCSQQSVHYDNIFV